MVFDLLFECKENTHVKKKTSTMGLLSGIKKIGKAIGSGIDGIINTAGEIFGRGIGLPGFFFDLIIPWPRKKLRMRILILQNEDGSPMDPTRDLVVEARAAYDLARDIFKREANVKLISYGNLARVEVLDVNPPAAALSPPCNGPHDSFGDAGWFYLANKQYSVSILLLGNGAPISAFVVREIANDTKVGCSPGAFADHLVVSLRGLSITSTDDVGGASRRAANTLAHEIGHSCGLNYMAFKEHSDKKNNLMYPDERHDTGFRGTNLNRLQVAGLRNSRFVTYL